MPIEENLSPQLPSLNFKMNYIQTSLVSTTQYIDKLNIKNVQVSNDSMDINQDESMNPNN